MNKTILFISVLIFSTLSSMAQDKESTQRVMDLLVGGTWFGTGAWNDGSKFNQEISVEKSLGDQIYIVKTVGNIGGDEPAQGLRNHGVRAWDSSTGVMKFFEFDIFGGITEGTVVLEGKNIFYVYEYEGQILTDAWIYKNDNTFEFVVGIRSGDEWTEVFCNAGFRRS